MQEQRKRQLQARRANKANRKAERQKEQEAERKRIQQEQAARRIQRREQRQEEQANKREEHARAREEREQIQEQRCLWHQELQRERAARQIRQAERAARRSSLTLGPHQLHPRKDRFSTLSLNLSSRLSPYLPVKKRRDEDGSSSRFNPPQKKICNPCQAKRRQGRSLVLANNSPCALRWKNPKTKGVQRTVLSLGQSWSFRQHRSEQQEWRNFSVQRAERPERRRFGANSSSIPLTRRCA